jgi:hypothetical protein
MKEKQIKKGIGIRGSHPIKGTISLIWEGNPGHIFLASTF